MGFDMKRRTILLTSSCLIAVLAVALAVVLKRGSRTEYVYTMAEIRKWHSGERLIEIIGHAEEPYKRLTPITIAGVEGGDGSALVYDQPQPRRKTFHAIDGYHTVLHPYIGKDERIVYAVEKWSPTKSEKVVNTDGAPTVTSQQAPAGDVLKAAPEE